MFQNIKTDIIYHKTSTDFEMEFNLCGCCRMRLLTDKSPDNKTFVHNLARAVSRSKIIIVTGNLFGNDGIIYIASQAIRKKLEVIDNELYNINSTDKISVIKDSTPLVSKDGFFGGCIIESGPQTMILISDNKNIRKNIMQTLIHPYIKEVYFANSVDTTYSPYEVPSPIITDTSEDYEVSTSYDDKCDIALDDFETTNLLIDNEESLSADNSVENIESVEETIADEYQEDRSDILLFEDEEYEEPSEQEEEKYIPKKYDESYQLISDEENFELDLYDTLPLEVEGSGIISDDDFVDDEFKRHFKFDLPIIILSVLLLILLAFIGYFLVYLPLKNGFSSIDYIKYIFGTLFPTGN